MQSIKNVFLTIYYKFFDNKNNTYASFSKRFGSFVIDSIIILIIFISLIDDYVNRQLRKDINEKYSKLNKENDELTDSRRKWE